MSGRSFACATQGASSSASRCLCRNLTAWHTADSCALCKPSLTPQRHLPWPRDQTMCAPMSAFGGASLPIKYISTHHLATAARPSSSSAVPIDSARCRNPSQGLPRKTRSETDALRTSVPALMIDQGERQKEQQNATVAPHDHPDGTFAELAAPRSPNHRLSARSNTTSPIDVAGRPLVPGCKRQANFVFPPTFPAYPMRLRSIQHFSPIFFAKCADSSSRSPVTMLPLKEVHAGYVPRG